MEWGNPKNRMGEARMEHICISFDSQELNSDKMGWKAYNLAVMYKNENFGVPFGVVLPTDLYREKVKGKIKDMLMGVFKQKIKQDNVLKRLIKEIEGKDVEEFIAQMQLSDIFKLLSKVKSQPYPLSKVVSSSIIISEATRKLRWEYKETQLNSWRNTLDALKKEINKLGSDAIYIRSSSNIDESILKEYPGAFKSDAKTKSYLKSDENIFGRIIDIYLSVLGSYATTDLFIDRPFGEVNMAILFQEKETPSKSGSAKCYKKEGNGMTLNVEITIYEGEGIISVKGQQLKEKKPDENFTADKVTVSIECRKDKDGQKFNRLQGEEYIPGGQTYILIFDPEENDFVSDKAEIQGELLSSEEQTNLFGMIVDIFRFWMSHKNNLLGQKIEFVVPKFTPNIIRIVQCDNYTGG